MAVGRALPLVAPVGLRVGDALAEILEHARARPVKTDDIARTRAVKVKLDVTLGGRLPRHLVKQPAFKLARLDFEFRASGPVDNPDLHSGLPDAIQLLRGEIPLKFLPAELFDPRQQGTDGQLGHPFR